MKTTSLRSSSSHAAALLSVLAAFSAPAARAQLYWDTNGATAGAGSVADGVWDTTTANWTSDATGSSATGVYASGSAVVFSAGSDTTAATISVSSVQTASSITVNQGNITLANGTTNINGFSTVTVVSGASLSMGNSGSNSIIFNIDGSFTGGQFTGGSIMTKNGTGTASFTRFDAILTVNAGKVIVSGGGKLKNTTVSNGGTLQIAGDAFESTRNLTVSAGGTVEVSSGVSDTVAALTGSGSLVGANNSTLSFGNGTATSTFSGSIGGDLTLGKIGTGTFTFGGAHASTGDITVSAGTFTLADAGSLTFYIGADGVNNFVDGVGVANFNGDFNFDLSGADLVNGNSWSIVSSSLSKSFGTGFGVNGFSETVLGSGIWTNGGFTFDEASGNLSYAAVPEPSAFALLGGFVALGFAGLRRRKLRTAPAAV